MVQNIDKSLNNLSSHVTDEFLNKITSSVGTVKQKFADIEMAQNLNLFADD